MDQHVVLLRGINLGPHKRIAMPELRGLLLEAGFPAVRTYVQSGNVVLATDASPEELAERCESLIQERFGFQVPIVTRTREELEEIVRCNPLRAVADEPKRYQVTFTSAEPTAEAIAKLEVATQAPERLVAIGRELYSWHPEGIARSRLWAALAGRGLGVTATARNWTTVTKLLELAGEE